MPSGFEGMRRESRSPRLLLSLLVIILTFWAITLAFYLTLGHNTSLSKPLNASQDIQRKRTIDFNNLMINQTSSDLSRLLLKLLLEESRQNDTLQSNEQWKTYLMNGVSIVAVQKMSLLLQKIHHPSVHWPHCSRDKTLDPLEDFFRSVFIASNLHNSQEILPNMIHELLALILDHSEITFFISIYESGSSDQTPKLLHLFSDVLEEIGVLHDIQFNGLVTRDEGTERIQFLSEVRNAAMRPLFTQSAFGNQWDRVVFINDVYFCKEDMHRLLLHDGDIVCGMDFMHSNAQTDPFSKSNVADIKRAYYRERLKDDKNVQKALVRATSPSAKQWESNGPSSKTLNLETTEQRVGMQIPFYDIWVSHDTEGHHFGNAAPYISNASYGIHRMEQGLPFPAQCCWNGMAILNPEPFLRNQLQFRSAEDDECNTSECVLLCHDFQRLGFRKVIIDPSVWLTYSHITNQILQFIEPEKIKRVPWKAVLEAKPMKDVQIKPGQLVDCCSLKPKEDFVDFGTCQTNYSLWNVTSALNRLQIRKQEFIYRL